MSQQTDRSINHPIVVITGAKTGIGLEMTRQLLQQNHQVIAGVRGAAKAEELLALKGAGGGELTVLELDVQSDASVAKFSTDIKLSHIDVLINNAGIYESNDKRFDETSAPTLLKTFDTNCAGPLRVTTALIRFLKKAENPRIANISSKMGSIGENSSAGSTAYRISKAALNMLTKNIALEQPEMISLTLHPGWVRTQMGGPSAPLSVLESATGLLKIIAGATRTQSGKFINYDGKEIGW